MGDDNSTAVLARIRDGLRPLLTDDASLEKVSRAIKDRIAFLSWKPPPDSEFFDFERKVDQVVRHFDGLTRRDYLRAAVKQPSLFYLNPATLIQNVEIVADHFAAEGLTRVGYLKAALKQPSLFGQKPATIIENIEIIVDHFAADGLTRADYLKAALKQPPLFAMKPGTVIGHLNLVADLYRQGVLQLSASPSGPRTETTPVVKMMISQPALLCLADDNFALREIHAHVTGTALSAGRLRKTTRADVERELAEALGSAGRNAPIRKIDPEAGAGPHARNLLLRALVRQGMIKGRLE